MGGGTAAAAAAAAAITRGAVAAGQLQQVCQLPGVQHHQLAVLGASDIHLHASRAARQRGGKRGGGVGGRGGGGAAVRAHPGRGQAAELSRRLLVQKLQLTLHITPSLFRSRLL